MAQKLKGKWHLVRMRPRRGEKADNWLLIKANDAEARTAKDPDILEEEPNSVMTGHSLEEIAGDAHSRRWTSGKSRTIADGDRQNTACARFGAAHSACNAEETDGDEVSLLADARRKAPRPAKRPTTHSASQPPKAAKRAALPKFVPPMLPTLIAAPPQGAGWIHEIKFDGYRMEACSMRGRSRCGRATGSIGPIASLLSLKPSPNSRQRNASSTAKSSSRTRTAFRIFGASEALKEGKTSGLVYYAFDLLHLDGFDLMEVPLVERKDLLKRLLTAEPGIGSYGSASISTRTAI